MGVQVSFQLLDAQTRTRSLWALFIRPSSRGHDLSCRRVGRLSPKEEWQTEEELPSVWPRCAVLCPTSAASASGRVASLCHPTLLGAHRNLANTRQ